MARTVNPAVIERAQKALKDGDKRNRESLAEQAETERRIQRDHPRPTVEPKK